MTPSQNTVEVTQADRELASKILREVNGPPAIDHIRLGNSDAHPWVQAFAEHRIASRTPAQGTALYCTQIAMGKLCVALRLIADGADHPRAVARNALNAKVSEAELRAALQVPAQGTDTNVVERVALLADIASMMSEFVDNWPQPKKVSTALALIAKTMRAALDPPKHQYWGAGEPDCPREIKAGNGELHTLRCKVCGEDNPRGERCLAAISPPSTGDE